MGRPSASTAVELWNWTLAKQGLSQATRHWDPLAVAESSLGLHAARSPSPYATAVSRTFPQANVTSILGPTGDMRLATVRCMRSTLHVLPVHLASVALAATRGLRLPRVAALASKASINWSSIERCRRWLEEVLAEGPARPRQLESRGQSDGWTVGEVRIALKASWEYGAVSYRNVAPSWHRQDRQFSLTKSSHPDLDVELDPQLATDLLFAAYFRRYGPATILDAAWWSGLPKGRVVDSLSRLSIVPMHLPWAGSDFYMLEDEYAVFCESTAEQHTTGINCLAHEDVALKAYFESRSRYLGEVPRGRVFNSIGEALPVIMSDGQVVGRWWWEDSNREVRYRRFKNLRNPADPPRLREHVAVLRDRLRAGYSSVS